MPPFARLLALSITVALAALGAAPAAQAAVLPLAHATVDGRRQPARRRRRRRRHAASSPRRSTTPTRLTTLTGLTATLATQTAGVTIDQGSSAYPTSRAAPTRPTRRRCRSRWTRRCRAGRRCTSALTVTNGTGSAVVPFTIATGAQGDFADYTGSPAVIGETLPSLRKVLVVGQLRGPRARDRPRHRRGGSGQHRQPHPPGHQPPLAGAQGAERDHGAAGRRRARNGRASPSPTPSS